MCAGQRIGHGKTDVNFWAQAAAKSLALLDAESLKARTVASPERSLGTWAFFDAPQQLALDHHLLQRSRLSPEPSTITTIQLHSLVDLCIEWC